jgi:[acyl-carrier-protein] S-malonyltransferase
MGRLAFVFSGQGAQRAGMGHSFYESDPAVRALFDQAEAERPGTRAQCFSGTDEELKLTENTQPCLYLADLAAALAMQNIGLHPDAVAGFSLGEIPALAFAGAYTPGVGFQVASLRGRFMAEAAREKPAGMLAVLRLDDAAVEAVCAEIPLAWPVNYNAPGQVVVSCAEESLSALREAIKKAGGRAVPLAVSGGFHCPLMEGAAARFNKALSGLDLKTPALPVYANCTARPYEGQPAPLMTQQLTSPVLWRRLIENMALDGFDTFVEVGVGATLKGLIERILPQSRVFSVSNTEEAASVLKEVSNHVEG